MFTLAYSHNGLCNLIVCVIIYYLSTEAIVLDVCIPVAIVRREQESSDELSLERQR